MEHTKNKVWIDEETDHGEEIRGVPHWSSRAKKASLHNLADGACFSRNRHIQVCKAPEKVPPATSVPRFCAYRERLADIRQTFPQPVSDRCHDAYFGFTIMRAIDKVDSLKSKVPVLGTMDKNDYKLSRQSSLPDTGESVEHVNEDLVHKLEGKIYFMSPCSKNSKSWTHKQ